MLFRPGFKKTFHKEVYEIKQRIVERNLLLIDNGNDLVVISMTLSIRERIQNLRIRLAGYHKNPDFQILGLIQIENLQKFEQNI